MHHKLGPIQFSPGQNALSLGCFIGFDLGFSPSKMQIRLADEKGKELARSMLESTALFE